MMPGPDRWRARLEAERRDTAARLLGLRADFDAVVASSVDSNADDEHDPEGATIAFERSQVNALSGQAERHLAEIDAALGRVAVGTYGMCGSCGRPIAEARLDARPVARLCIECASLAR